MSGFKRLHLAASLILMAGYVVFGLNALAGVQVPENPDHAWYAPNAPGSLLLDIHAYGDDADIWVAGERGHILKRNQDGSWKQASVDAQVLLTAIYMFDDRYG